MKKRLFKIIICCLIVFANFNLIAFAESKTADFVVQERNEDLQVLFTFDKEVVDIEFISPNGKVLSKSDVIYESGDLWASYRIVDAEVGQWKVRYDKKSNEFINYSIADNNQGLWAQYFNLNEIEDISANVSFRFDTDSLGDEYNYEISAFDIVASSSVVVLRNTALANQDISINLDLSELSSGDYKFMMDAWKEIGLAEVFDSIETKTFTYNNPNEPEAIDDFKLTIYPEDHRINVNWKSIKKLSGKSIKVSFYGDDKFILATTHESSENHADFFYYGDTKKIKVDVQYKNDIIWSKKCSKEVVLDDNYLHIERDNNSKTLNLKYRVKDHGKINVYNDLSQEDTYLDTKGNGSYLIDLLNGENNIVVQLSLDNNIYYIIYDNYYYNNLTPSIRLFENINGKTFNSNKVSIIGEAKNADSVQINSELVELKNGIFDYEVVLNPGENLFEILASRDNGTASKMTVKLYKRGGTIDTISIDNFASNAKNFIPLFASLFTSIIIIIISFFKTRETNNEEKVSNNILINVLLIFVLAGIEGLLCLLYIKRSSFSNSLEFLTVIEDSIKNAFIYLEDTNKILIAIIAVGVLIILNILFIVIKNKNKKAAH